MFIACTTPPGTVFFVLAHVVRAYHKYFMSTAPSCSIFLHQRAHHTTPLFLGQSLATEYGWFNYQHMFFEEEAETETRKNGEQSDHLLLPKKVVFQVFYVHFQCIHWK